MSKKRLGFIDFMKGLCIMLIVMHHTDVKFFDAVAPGLDNALQSFRVPMYYFLSGLFFKSYTGFGNFLRRKVNNLIIPFVFFHIVGYLVAAITFHFIHPGGTFNWHGIVMPLTQRWWSYTIPLWFLISLFEVNIIYYALSKFMPSTWRTALIIVLSFIPYIFTRYSITPPLMIDTAFVGLPFFTLGTTIKGHDLLKPARYDKWGIAVFPAAAIIIYLFAGHIDILIQQYPNYGQLYVLPMTAILALLWACKNLRWWRRDEHGSLTASAYARIPVIGYIGQFSLIVLGTHDLILTPLDAIMADAQLPATTMALVKWGITMAAMFVIIPVMVKLFPKFTAQSPLIPVD